MKINRSMRTWLSVVIRVVGSTVGVVWVISGLFFFIFAISFYANAISTQGDVIRFEPRIVASRGFTEYVAIVKYQTRSGEVIEADAIKSGTRPEEGMLPQKVQVWYDPSSPQSLRIGSPWQAYAPAVAGVLGGALVLAICNPQKWFGRLVSKLSTMSKASAK